MKSTFLTLVYEVLVLKVIPACLMTYFFVCIILLRLLSITE